MRDTSGSQGMAVASLSWYRKSGSHVQFVTTGGEKCQNYSGNIHITYQLALCISSHGVLLFIMWTSVKHSRSRAVFLVT